MDQRYRWQFRTLHSVIESQRTWADGTGLPGGRGRLSLALGERCPDAEAERYSNRDPQGDMAGDHTDHHSNRDADSKASPGGVSTHTSLVPIYAVTGWRFEAESSGGIQ